MNLKRVCLYGLLASAVLFFCYVGIQNLVRASRRHGQMRTMSYLRAIGTAVEGYAVDNKHYPPGNSTVAAIRSYIEPKYIKGTPLSDYWGNTFLYRSDGKSYTITSPGKDHLIDSVPTIGAINRFVQDIVFSNGSFLSFPEGT